MRDVARLVRVGELDTARRLSAAANKMAGHRASRVVAEELLRSGANPDPAALDATTGGALTRLATLTESARRKHLDKLGVETITGRIAEVSGRTASLVAADGTVLPLPSSSATPNQWAGALVSVDTELMPGGATIVWVRPAFDSDADPNERTPGDIHVLTSAQRDRLDQPAAAVR